MPDQNENLRRLTSADITAVMRVQQECYTPPLFEEEAAFQNKQSLFSDGSFGYFLNGRLEAYIFSHPWTTGKLVPLNQNISLPECPDCMYIHDLAVSPACRRRGVAGKLINEIFRIGDKLRLPKYALVAVQSSEAFWTQEGFKPVKIIDYGGGAATYMALYRGRI